MKKFWVALGVLLLTASAFGQGKSQMKELPNVRITGGGAPVLENNDDRGIIAYQVSMIYGNGAVGPSELKTGFFDVRAGKIPIPAHSTRALLQQQYTLTQTLNGPPRVEGGIVGAILQAVLFEDGELVGLDSTPEHEARLQQTFALLQARIDADHGVHQKLAKAASPREKEAAWEEIQRAADRPRGRRDPSSSDSAEFIEMQGMAANEMLMVRARQGEAAAIELAKTSAKYPKIWRKKK